MNAALKRCSIQKLSELLSWTGRPSPRKIGHPHVKSLLRKLPITFVTYVRVTLQTTILV